MGFSKDLMGSMLNKKCSIRSGQTGIGVFRGIFAFTTTGTTKDVVVPLRNVDAISLTYFGAPAASEAPLSANNTVTGTAGTDDAKVAGSNGSTTITVTRPAGTTSGIKFSLIAYGQE
jgi:hypothetical protein